VSIIWDDRGFPFQFLRNRSEASIEASKKLKAFENVQRNQRRGSMAVKQRIIAEIKAGTGWHANVKSVGNRKNRGPYYWHEAEVKGTGTKVYGIGRTAGSNNVPGQVPMPKPGDYLNNVIDAMIAESHLKVGWCDEQIFSLDEISIQFFEELDEFCNTPRPKLPKRRQAKPPPSQPHGAAAIDSDEADSDSETPTSDDEHDDDDAAKASEDDDEDNDDGDAASKARSKKSKRSMEEVDDDDDDVFAAVTSSKRSRKLSSRSRAAALRSWSSDDEDEMEPKRSRKLSSRSRAAALRSWSSDDEDEMEQEEDFGKRFPPGHLCEAKLTASGKSFVAKVVGDPSDGKVEVESVEVGARQRFTVAVENVSEWQQKRRRL